LPIRRRRARIGGLGAALFRSRGLSRAVSLIAAWAFTLQLLVPADPALGLQGDGDSVPAWVLAAVCHVETSEVPSDRRHDPRKQSSDGNSAPCLLCCAAHSLDGLLPPKSPALSLPDTAGSVPFTPFAPFAFASHHRSSARARAPPRTVV